MNHAQFTPFIINLNKTNEGYTFHSLEEHTQPQPKPKKTKQNLPKNNQSKITNRLIKEIGLISDLPPLIQEEPEPSKEPLNYLEEPPRQEFEPPQEEEEIDIEIKRSSVLPPCPCEWFDYSSIHPIQMDLFPEFHSGKSYKTPELYQCFRNFMIDAYRKNPQRYLTFAACRRVLRGDASCLLRIYQFLEAEGIINYCLFNEGNYTFQISAVDKVSELTKRPQSCIKKLPDANASKRDEQMDTDNLTVTVINKNFSRTFRVYCSKCKLICGIVWYSTLDENQRHLCFECYSKSEPEAVRQFMKVDILKKMESSKDSKVNKTSWGLQDNIKLLDYMGNCEGRTWKELMDQFEGKKALEDIIIQFMQFPITNYDPQYHASLIKHEQIDYAQQQHVDMLMDLYEKSSFCKKDETKEEEQADTESAKEYHGNQAPRFHSYSNLILRKYIQKMESLKRMETVLQQTSLSIIQQPLYKRLRVCSTGVKEQSDDLNGYEDD